MDELQVEFQSAEEQVIILASIDNRECKVLALLMLDVGSCVTDKATKFITVRRTDTFWIT